MTNSQRDEAIEILLKAAELAAEAEGCSVLDAARLILQGEEGAKIEREMSPYDKGRRDGEDGERSDPGRHGYEDEADVEAYGEGHNDGAQMREDLRVEQIERDYLDGECSLDGHYYA